MTRADFVTALEMELQLRGVGFDLAALESFVASCWPLIVDDPDVARWAVAFIDAGQVTMQA